MKTLVSVLFLLSFCHVWGDYTSSNWDSFKKKDAEGISIEVPYKVTLKGTFEDGVIVLEGKTRIKDRKLEKFFKQQELENQSYQQSQSQMQSMDTMSQTMNSQSQMGGYYGGAGYGIIQKSTFKLLRLNPIAGTSKVTAEVFIGEEPFTPHLEVLDVRLNPFKRTSFEVVQSYLEEIALRHVKVVVTITTNVADENRDKEFTADFDGSLVIGDTDVGPDPFMDGFEEPIGNTSTTF